MTNGGNNGSVRDRDTHWPDSASRKAPLPLQGAWLHAATSSLRVCPVQLHLPEVRLLPGAQLLLTGQGVGIGGTPRPERLCPVRHNSDERILPPAAHHVG